MGVTSQEILRDPQRLSRALEQAGGIKGLARELGVCRNTVRKWMDRYGLRGREQIPSLPEDSAALAEYLRKPRTLEEIADHLDCSPKATRKKLEAIKAAGYQVVEIDGKYQLDTIPQETRETYEYPEDGEQLKFAIISDTHLGSKKQQLSYLCNFYARCAAEGIANIYHVGDLIDGFGLYRGQIHEVFAVGYEDQTEYAIAEYPRLEGITTHVISGNHDLSFLKAVGADPLVKISMARPDIHYLGQFSARIQLAPNFTLDLLHPDGGPAYALSYKLQRIIAGLEGGNKPNMLALGHWHSWDQLFERNVHGFLVPCFQAQTDYQRRKGLNPVVGGVIIEIWLNEDRSVQRIKTELVPYLRHKDHDY